MIPARSEEGFRATTARDTPELLRSSDGKRLRGQQQRGSVGVFSVRVTARRDGETDGVHRLEVRAEMRGKL